MVFYNKIIDKGSLKKLIGWAFSKYGSARTAMVADHLKELGFRYATKAGVSISVEDLQVPAAKRKMLESAEQEITKTEQRYSKGEITEVERFQKVIDTWNSTSEALKDEVVRNFKETDPLNSVYMMAFSGARGNMSQVRQLVGMRGLMANPQGEIIDLPIKTNFREGLTVTEYIISSYGARKGLVDTALRTADSGYLTRRLVDVSQDVIVRDLDCGTEKSISLKAMTDGSKVLIPLSDRLLGRVLAADVIDPKTGEIIATRNQSMDDELSKKIGRTVNEVQVRSALTCESARSVCQACYGWSLAHGVMVNLGEAVGIIAAQSIGEPGTQLTMRTFHTGGVFTGEVAQQIIAEHNGQISFDKGLTSRKFRTSHGDEREQVEVAGDFVISSDGKKKSKYSLSVGSILYLENGQRVEKGQLIAEVSSAKVQKSTEKATKNVSSDLSGEVVSPELMVEDKKDRQGNITRTASRGGLLWVLSGEVYNLPPSAEPVVKNGSQVDVGSILAETKLVSNSGGVVRLHPGTREIEIVTASVLLDKAIVKIESTSGKEQCVIYSADNKRYLLKATPGMKVQNHQVVAELIDDRYRTKSGGIIKYAGVEVSKGNRKQGYEVTQGGTLLWIPEETHEVNKDISLLIVEDGMFVEAGTEVVKDIYCQSSGLVEVIQKNDILREIVIKPGELHLDVDPDLASVYTEGQVVSPGTEVIPGIIVDELKYCEFVETPEGYALLLRSVEEYTVAKIADSLSQGSINTEGGRQIELSSVQRLFYKDGERVKSVEGVSLLTTQLILEIISDSSHSSDRIDENSAQISADIELVPDEEDPDSKRLQMVILESLVMRRDTDSDPYGGTVQTRLLVEDGQEIPRGAVVTRTEIQCKDKGEVRGIKEGAEAVRRILIVRNSDLITINCTDPQVKVGDLVVADSEIARGLQIPESGKIVALKKIENGETEVTIRIARPYRVSPGAVLHVSDSDLVQRGDSLVLLVFERAKTGDIIQGLPRIEELLEARKPKEACILSKRPGTCQVEYSEHDSVDIKIIEDDGRISEYPITSGQSVMVSDGQRVDAGEYLTDGPANPHEMLEIFFNYYIEDRGIYESALLAFEKVQKFLVGQVQTVYQSQGIDISDKHIEVIVRQMTSKVRVDDGGDTINLPGELTELRQVEQSNDSMAITGGAPARYTPVLLGITKASLNTDSFISAASFQETTRVLTEAAIEGKSDWLRGLKENVIIGRLIPAGTGFNAYEESQLNGGDSPEDSQDDLSIRGGNSVYSRQSGDKRSLRSTTMPLGQSRLIPERDSLILDDVLDDDSAAMEGFPDAENVVLDDQTARAYTRVVGTGEFSARNDYYDYDDSEEEEYDDEEE